MQEFDGPACIPMSLVTSYSLEKNDIESKIVHGHFGDKESVHDHAYSAVKVDGILYRIDLTAGQFMTTWTKEIGPEIGPYVGVVIVPLKDYEQGYAEFWAMIRRVDKYPIYHLRPDALEDLRVMNKLSREAWNIPR